MKQEVNPKDTSRAKAFELWMSSPMPMVTLTKTFDVTQLCKMSRRSGLKFTATDGRFYSDFYPRSFVIE